MQTEDVILILILPTLGILGGVAVIVAALIYRARVLELMHKERVAMIERGLTPPDLGPEPARPQGYAGTRSRSFSLGIIVVGVGFALMTIIGIAGQAPNEAVGIGGAIVILGAAFIVRSLLVTPEAAPPPSGPAAAPVAPAAPLTQSTGNHTTGERN